MSLKITCAGRTPARITATAMIGQCLEAKQKLPLVPDYSKVAPRPGTIFLTPNDFVIANEQSIFRGLEGFGLSVVEMQEAIEGGIARFVIFGYVDYIDTFNQRHRCGYAREYDYERDNPDLYSDEEFPKRNNFVSAPETSYTYDRNRKPDEGNDW